MIFAVVLLVFFVFTVAVTVRPANVIAMAIGVYAFEQWAQANDAYFGSHAAFVNFGFGILCLYALGMLVLRGINPLNPVTGAACVWLAMFSLAAVSCLWSLDRNLSLFLFKFNLPYVVTFVGIVPLVINDRDDLRKSLTLTLAFGTVVAILLLTGTHIHSWGRTIEVSEGLGVVNRVGEFEKRLAPLAVAELCGQLMIIAVLMNYRGMARIWQIARWGIVVVALVLIFRSGSRGQLIAALFSIVTLIAFSRGSRRIVGLVAATVTIGGVLVATAWSFSSYAGQAASRWDLTTMESTYKGTRLEYCVRLLDFWAGGSPFNWLFGLGSSSSYDPRLLGNYCHVTVVEVLAELGLVGLLLLITFGLFVGRDALRLYRLTKDSEVDRGVAVTMTALFLFGVILSLKQGSFLMNTYVFMFGLMISRHAVVVQRASALERARQRQRWWSSYYHRLELGYAATSPRTELGT